MAAAVAATLLGGCGGEDPNIDGGWGLALSESCAVVMVFDTAEASYAAQLICRTGVNTYGSDIEMGDADFSDPGKIRSTPRRASCPGTDHTAGIANYSFSGKRLVIAGDGGATFYDPVPDEPADAAASVQFGCWDMGRFTAHPVQDL